MGIPRHPDTDDDVPAKKATGWQTKVVVAVIVLLLVAFIALHLTGVLGPKMHWLA